MQGVSHSNIFFFLILIYNLYGQLQLHEAIFLFRKSPHESRYVQVRVVKWNQNVDLFHGHTFLCAQQNN